MSNLTFEWKSYSRQQDFSIFQRDSVDYQNITVKLLNQINLVDCWKSYGSFSGNTMIRGILRKTVVSQLQHELLHSSNTVNIPQCYPINIAPNLTLYNNNSQ